MDPADLAHISTRYWHLAVPVEKLQIDPDNERAHGTTDLAVTRSALERTGQNQPLAYNPSNANRMIRGNGRLIVARQLGWKYVAAEPVRLAQGEHRAAAIEDNRTGEFTPWDEVALAESLATYQEVQEVQQDLLLEDLVRTEPDTEPESVEFEATPKHQVIIENPNRRQQDQLVKLATEWGLEFKITGR